MVRHCINNYRNWRRISIICWIDKRHPYLAPTLCILLTMCMECEFSACGITVQYDTCLTDVLPLIFGLNVIPIAYVLQSERRQSHIVRILILAEPDVVITTTSGWDKNSSKWHFNGATNSRYNVVQNITRCWISVINILQKSDFELAPSRPSYGCIFQ